MILNADIIQVIKSALLSGGIIVVFYLVFWLLLNLGRHADEDEGLWDERDIYR